MPNLLEQLKHWRWFHGNITRQEAEDILRPNIDGSYLLRESISNSGEFIISVYHNSEMIHYIIHIRNNTLSLDSTIYFYDLHTLIKHYTTNLHTNICLSQPVSDYCSLKSNLERLHYMITPDKLELKEVIDKGEFSEVYEGCYQTNTVAVKKSHSVEFVKNILQEANIMAMLKHRNLLQMVGVMIDKDVYLVMEYMEEGNLIGYLRSRGREVITEDCQINLSFDICAGMAYLESKNLVHCDLAARNILLGKNGLVKISDFGLSKQNDTKDTRHKLPVRWTAPEAIASRVFTHKCDVWSFGVLLWEIFSFGKTPYPGVPAANISDYVKKGNRMNIPEECPKNLQMIIEKTWDIDPLQRPTFQKILELMSPLFGSLV